VKTQRASPPPQSCCWLPPQGMLHDELLAAVAMLTVDELEQKHSAGAGGQEEGKGQRHGKRQ